MKKFQVRKIVVKDGFYTQSILQVETQEQALKYATSVWSHRDALGIKQVSIYDPDISVEVVISQCW